MSDGCGNGSSGRCGGFGGLDEEEGRVKVVVVGGTVSVVVAGVSSECISSITLLCILEIKIRKEAEGRKGVKKEKGREKKRRQEGRRDIRVFLNLSSSLRF